MPTIALATAVASTGHDTDLQPLLEACAAAGLIAEVRAWDDQTVSWSRYDAVLLRSPWDYTERLAEFLQWCTHVSAQSALLNPLQVVRWNTDKHYLLQLAAQGVAVVPSTFVEPGMEPLPTLEAFLAGTPGTVAVDEFVVKPAVGAGSCDAQRYARGQEFAAANHIARLLDAERSVLLQPYLPAIDRDGETALVHFNGAFSHAVRKAPLLQPDGVATSHVATPDVITARTPGADELALAALAIDATSALLGLAAPLAYARVDLIRDTDGAPRLLELELCEPALFFTHAPGSAERFVQVLREALTT